MLTTHKLTAAVILPGLLALVLACGPSAPAGQDASPSPETTAAPEPTPTILWLNSTPPSESELATSAARPTMTPFPPGYVRPTHIPTVPPLSDAELSATLAAEIATEEAQRPPESAPAQAVDPTLPPTLPPPLTEQVTQYARDMQGSYDAVAHVKAGAIRAVEIPDSVSWPHNEEPILKGVPGYDSLVRTTLTAITIYYGTLPQGYELVSYPGADNGALDTGEEYVFFISKDFVRASEYSPRPGRLLYNQTQLEAMGGAGGGKFALQSWAVEGNQAWRIPVEHFANGPAGSDLAAAKAGGESLSLSELAAAIRAGLPE